jgi:hypothetical protein
MNESITATTNHFTACASARRHWSDIEATGFLWSDQSKGADQTENRQAYADGQADGCVY